MDDEESEEAIDQLLWELGVELPDVEDDGADDAKPPRRSDWDELGEPR